MSFRVGGGRARRIRGKGSARKADRAPKSAADLDAEMEVCTFETYLDTQTETSSFRIILLAMVPLSLPK